MQSEFCLVVLENEANFGSCELPLSIAFCHWVCSHICFSDRVSHLSVDIYPLRKSFVGNHMSRNNGAE